MADCLPHVPHKAWADDRERMNYEAIERWAKLMHDHPTGGVATPLLLIPYKDWSGDPAEFANYLEIERWARHFQTMCLAPGVVPI